MRSRPASSAAGPGSGAIRTRAPVRRGPGRTHQQYAACARARAREGHADAAVAAAGAPTAEVIVIIAHLPNALLRPATTYLAASYSLSAFTVQQPS